MALTLSNVVSGFTITPSTVYTGVTPVEFSVTYSNAVLDFNAIWIFGDGNYYASTDTTVTHIYQQPGTYTVTLIVFNTIEEFRNYILQNSLSLGLLPTLPEYNVFTQGITVTDSLTDYLVFSNTPVGVLQSRIQSVPFRLEFAVNRNVIPGIQLYSQNSNSQPWQSIDQKWSHLKPVWKFLDIDKVAVDILIPKTENVSTIVYNGTSLSAVPFNASLDSTLAVGVSGYAEFYYSDDLPATVTLHATLDTQGFNNPAEQNYSLYAPSYANSTLAVSANYDIFGSTPTQLVITSNGMDSFTLGGTKWLYALIPYVITICDSDNYILHNFPIDNTSGATYAINRTIASIDSAGIIYESPSAYFSRYDNQGKDVGGYYTGFFQSLSTIGVTQFIASATVQLSSGTVTLSGVSDSFDIVDYATTYDVRKFNESFDMAATFKSYALQDTIAQNNVLFDDFLGQIVGNIDSPPESIGKSIYEKIANYVGNSADIDTCNIDKLYSICTELNIPIENYNFDYPTNLKRLMNILSISYSRLKGSRNKYGSDFDREPNLTSAKNLGNKIDTTTYYITAGTNFVINEKFTGAFEIFNAVPYNSQNIYPVRELSAFNFQTPLETYYKLYEYIPYTDNTQQEGVIEWDNTQTTLNEGVSSVDTWLNDSGIVTTILDYQLRKGLELISI